MAGSDAWVFDVHLPDFDQRVLQASFQRPVLVDFWADWCSPCIFLDPILKEVVAGFAGKVLLAKVEVDEGENMKLAGKHRVRGFPTVIMFVDGVETSRFSSARPRHFIETFIDTALAAKE